MFTPTDVIDLPTRGRAVRQRAIPITLPPPAPRRNWGVTANAGLHDHRLRFLPGTSTRYCETCKYVDGVPS